ncbi:uncharacterized protein CEXT_597111 [Caerostris extrusa]|uniref:Uncharacterized protein n=1 Tax=Caerostris extrusa TaxID=172846 RepID=A0AAV4U8U3_CAEEX|nr:uncharacterized protein CEXT_597111 [Caerostris extrusa]
MPFDFFNTVGVYFPFSNYSMGFVSTALHHITSCTKGGHQVFQQPEHMKPATHLWRQFRLVELKQNMRRQGDTAFIDVLNALRVGELTAGHFEILLRKVSTDTYNEF